MNGSGNAPRHRTIVQARAKVRIRALTPKAMQRRVYASFIEELRRIVERLEVDPTDWGDPIRTLRGLKMVCYRGYQDGLLAYYAVHAEERVVWVGRHRSRAQPPAGGLAASEGSLFRFSLSLPLRPSSR